MLNINEQTFALAASGEKEELKKALQAAIELEHSTMPPYLYAMYSLLDTHDANNDHRSIARLLKEIVIDEMAHMLLNCNLLISIGGHPVIYSEKFVPNYPTQLPGCVADDFVVPLKKVSRDTIRTVFMRIEEPNDPLDIDTVPLEALEAASEPVRTIGEFYRRLQKVFEEKGDQLVDPATEDQQPTTYLPGVMEGEQKITSQDQAVAAIDLIVEQGEGTSKDPFVPGAGNMPSNRDLAHYYRFQSILEGKIAKNPNATEESPPEKKVVFNSNDLFRLEESKVRPFPDNPKAAHFAVGSDERNAIDEFNRSYTRMLKLLHSAVNGAPGQLESAIDEMTVDMTTAAENLALEFNLGPTFEFLPE